MRNSHKNGLMKSLTAILIVVLACALTLTGCSDKTARELANQALTAAQNAQDAADKAQTSAGNAQDKADDAQNSADANKNVIDALPDSEAVAAVVQDILNKYVKGAALSEDSIITMAELETFLASDEVATLLAQYVTVNTLAEYAKASDVTALSTQLETARNEITAALGTYVTVTAYETDKQNITKAITDLTTNLNAAIDTLATKESVEKINTALASYITKEEALKALEGYCTKADAENLQKKFNEYYTKGEIDTLIANIDLTTLKNELKAYTDEKVLDSQIQFEAATVAAIAAIKEINEKLANFAKIQNTFTAEEYDKMVNAYEDAKLELLRAQRVDSLVIDDVVVIKGVNQIVEEVNKFVKENVNNYGVQLYNALAAVEELIVPVDHITTDTYKSIDQINACLEILNAAKESIGEGTDAFILVMTIDGSYLPGELDLIIAEYDNLVAAKEGAADLIAAIRAIPAYATLTADNTAARAAFKAAVEHARDIEYAEWIDYYFTNNTTNVNIERILGAPVTEGSEVSVHDYYIGALAKLAALNTADEEAAALNLKIFNTLTAKGWYSNSYILYTDYAEIKALNEEVAAWVETNNVTDIPVVLANYNDLVVAYAYAEKINEAHEASAELIAKLDAAIALEVVLKNEEAFEEATGAYLAWMLNYNVDEANAEAILGEKAEKVTDAYERMAVLHAAEEAVKAINDKIAKFVSGEETKKFTGNINSMAAIREIRNDIVTWLNTYDIVPSNDENSALAKWIVKSSVEADVDLSITETVYFADNYNMINHEDLDFVISEFNKIVADAVAYANAYVIPAINNIKADDPKLLYQFKNIMTAQNAYYAWVIKYQVIDQDITHLDFGEGDSAVTAETGIVAKYVEMMNVYGEYLKLATEASKVYTDNVELINAFNEAVKNGVTVKNGNEIKAAHEFVAAWVAKYIDTEREVGAEAGKWSEVIQLIFDDPKSDAILPKADYDNIVKAYNDYEKLVHNARSEGEKLVENQSSVEVNVYNGAALEAQKQAYLNWMEKYGIEAADFEGTALDETLKFVKFDYINVVDKKLVDYAALVEKAVADFAAIKTSIENLKVEEFNIYAAEIVDPIRAAYNAWAKEYLTGNDVDAYTETLATSVAAFKTSLEALKTAEAAVETIETAKKAETETVKSMIEALVAADKVTTANKAAIEAARAAYDKWFNGDNNPLKAIDSAKNNAEFGYDLTEALAKLVAVENALGAIQDKFDDIFGANGIIDDATDAVNVATRTNPDSADYNTAIENAEKAIEDAYKAIEEFYNMNGNANNGAVTAETMEKLAALANAKMQLEALKVLNDPTVKAKENYAEIKQSIIASQTAAASSIKNTTLEAYEEYFATENKEAIDVFDLIADNTVSGYAHIIEKPQN